MEEEEEEDAEEDEGEDEGDDEARMARSMTTDDFEGNNNERGDDVTTRRRQGRRGRSLCENHCVILTRTHTSGDRQR